MRAKLRIWAVLPLLYACDQQTEECQKLTVLHGHYQSAVATFKGRAQLRPKLEKSIEELKVKTEKELGALWLNKPETALKTELDKRVAAVKGATMERTTKQVGSGVPGAAGVAHETMWRIKFREKNFEKAVKKLEGLSVSPPLFKLSTILQDRKTGDWILELVRASIDDVPMNLPPQKFPRPPKATVVPEEFGFCGAKELRAKIAKLDAELDKLEENSTALSTMLPMRATIEGRRRRGAYTAQLEQEGRNIISSLIETVRKSKFKMKALGVEQEVVILELLATKKDKGRLEKFIDPELLPSVKYIDSPTKGVLKVTIPNRVAAKHKDERGPGGSTMVPGVRLAPKHNH